MPIKVKPRVQSKAMTAKVLRMTNDSDSDGVLQITDVSYKTLTEHVTGHFISALKVLLSSACFRGDALDNAETFLCDTA